MDEKMREMGIRAKHAAGVLATLTTEEKNAGLLAIADALRARQTEIMAANALDLEAGKANGMSPALLDRLALNGDRIEGMAQAVRMWRTCRTRAVACWRARPDPTAYIWKRLACLSGSSALCMRLGLM